MDIQRLVFMFDCLKKKAIQSMLDEGFTTPFVKVSFVKLTLVILQIKSEHAVDQKKLLKRLLDGALHNVAFSDFTKLVEGFGLRLVRVRGSHHVFQHPGIPELINLQDVKRQVKPYQIRQFLKLVEKYNLEMEGKG